MFGIIHFGGIPMTVRMLGVTFAYSTSGRSNQQEGGVIGLGLNQFGNGLNLFMNNLIDYDIIQSATLGMAYFTEA